MSESAPAYAPRPTTPTPESEVKRKPPGRPKRTPDYKIAKGTDPERLTTAVNLLMKEGYEPVGGPYAFGLKRLYQSMVK